MGSKQGLKNEEISALPEFRNSDFFDEREKLALEYAEEICKTPVNVSDKLFEKLQRAFKEGQLLELTATIALENFRARFNRALKIESDQLYARAVSPTDTIEKPKSVATDP